MWCSYTTLLSQFLLTLIVLPYPPTLVLYPRCYYHTNISSLFKAKHLSDYLLLSTQLSSLTEFGLIINVSYYLLPVYHLLPIDTALHFLSSIINKWPSARMASSQPCLPRKLQIWIASTICLLYIPTWAPGGTSVSGLPSNSGLWILNKPLALPSQPYYMILINSLPRSPEQLHTFLSPNFPYLL